ncbi:hypothetical protein [Pseudomonas sp. NBRC 111127]|uniref:hypothetical protein n=1 Tax=Pseudomonas sp. NBRC 111127 TaxID=1661042 RepID=UPI000B29886A|nr:hypothetical protein [Pseudomonas sp. NBRC 111127]
MADQTQRLEIATVRAEVGSNIVFRFANDAANADSIPTQSGDIQNLKQVVLEIQQDAAEKISISTTIYPNVAAGLAETADQGIFLVQSNDADEIYAVWQNQSGTAVNTGKTALSATAIQAALDASNEAAQAAEDAADVATARTAGFLAPAATAPALRDNGLPLQPGDRYFNTTEQAEYIYKADGWKVNDSLAAIEALESDIVELPIPGGIPKASDSGVIDIGWLPDDLATQEDIQNLADSQSIPMANYSAIRNYSGSARSIRINSVGFAGFFALDELDNSSSDNGGTVLVGYEGRRWKRVFSGLADVKWFGASESSSDSSSAIELAFSSGLPLLLSGAFKAKKKIAGSGSLLLVGLGRDKSSITWESDSESIGLEQSPTSLNQQIRIQDFELISNANISGVMYYSSWSGLSGYTTLTSFSYKFIANRVVIRQVGSGRFTKGIELRNIFGGVIEHCHVYGQAPSAPRAPETYSTTHLYHISNDGSASNTVGVRMWGNHGYNGRYGTLVDDLEALDFHGNDMQACWDCMAVSNTIRKVNQYRITSNHFGGDNTAVSVSNARSFMMSGNEISWGSNRASGATIDLVSIYSVEDYSVIGNTVRGNSAVTTYGHVINGVKIDGVAGNESVYGLVDANRFRDLTSACTQGVNTTSLNFGLANQFNNVSVQFINTKGAGSQQPLRYGTGPHSNPTSAGPLLLLTGIGQSGLAINRDSAGSMQTFHVAGASAAGVITSTATTTAYGTTSDERLKDILRDWDTKNGLSVVNQIIIREVEWKSTGEPDITPLAQQLHSVWPAAVIQGHGEPGDEDFMPWMVDYSRLTVPLVSAIQELSRSVEIMQMKIQSLESEKK